MSSEQQKPQQIPQQEQVQEQANEIHVNLEDDELKCDDKQEDKSDKKGKKSSQAWDFFDEIKLCPVGFERAKCRLCKVIIGCNPTRNGTSAMMNRLRMACPKSPLRKNLDKLQKTLNATRFPILSEIAKHVLGMPVSSVASEAAFSTGGRTIDSYRSSLSPKTAEALICSQDWLRSSENVTDLRGEPEEYLQLEKLELAELKVVRNSFERLDIDDI